MVSKIKFNLLILFLFLFTNNAFSLPDGCLETTSSGLPSVTCTGNGSVITNIDGRTINFEGFPPPFPITDGFDDSIVGDQRRDAAAFAAKFLADRIESSVEIRILYIFGDRGLICADGRNGAVIASAGTFSTSVDSAGGIFPLMNVEYTSALRDALLNNDGLPPSATPSNPPILIDVAADIFILVNESIDSNNNDGLPCDCSGAINIDCFCPDFHYDPFSFPIEDFPNCGENLDFITTIIHEIIHGLGFSDNNEIDINGLPTGQFNLFDPTNSTDRFPSVLDANIFSFLNNTFLDQLTPMERMSTLQTPQDMHFDGERVAQSTSLINTLDFLKTNGLNGTSPQLFTPGPFQPGSSISHFNQVDSRSTPVTENLEPPDLMQPFDSGRDHNLTYSLALLSDLGWVLQPGNRINVIFNGNGQGEVGASDTATNIIFTCENDNLDCEAISEEDLLLIASASFGSEFNGWGGACTSFGTSNPITITPNQDTECIATFNDIDECTVDSDNCDVNATCTDEQPGFSCECNPGFEGDGVICTEIDDCDPNPCQNGGACTDQGTTFSCECSGTGFEGDTCELDLNECTLGTDNCDNNAACTNTIGSFTCACNAGFQGNGVTCADIDECTDETDNCDENATCTNSPGSFICACNDGYEGDGLNCADVDACTSFPCDQNATCTDLPPPALNSLNGRNCECNDGFEGSGEFCNPIDVAGDDDDDNDDVITADDDDDDNNDDNNDESDGLDDGGDIAEEDDNSTGCNLVSGSVSPKSTMANIFVILVPLLFSFIGTLHRRKKV